jgi:hypothetical protein
MKISFLSFFVSLLIILNVQNVRGGCDYHIHGEKWVDPDLLSRIYRDHALKTVGKESRLVTSVDCYFAMPIYGDNLRVKALFNNIFEQGLFSSRPFGAK